MPVIDNWYLGAWRVYWAACLSSNLTRGLSAEEMFALADFYSLVGRGIATIALAKKGETVIIV